MSEKKTYSFGIDFQQEILQFTVTDLRYGFKAIDLFRTDYFTTIPHSIIAEALIRFYKKKFYVPSLPVIKEEIRQIFKLRQWANLITEPDKEKVFKILKKIYAKPVRNAETIYEACKKFAQYSAFKDELEKVDLDNFDQYTEYQSRIQKAINIGTDLKEDKGLFVLRDVKSRVIRRVDTPPGKPTPWRQLNKLFNNGGTAIGNVIVVMGEEKKFKTGMLLNTARGYLKRGEVILYADFENGEDALGNRIDQGLVGSTRSELLSQKFDKQLMKIARKYARFGGEIIIKRFPAGSTTAHIAAYSQKCRDEYGLNITVALIDYPDVMGSTDHQTDETKRISQVYLDIKNLSETEKWYAVWCPSHLQRKDKDNKRKKVSTADIAKAIDKVRHADVVLSAEQDADEREAGIMRMELIVQRDGPPEGRVYFWVDVEKQRLKEFTTTDVEEMERIKAAEAAENDPPESGAASRFKNKKEVSDV
jgi:hypothetical protein